MPSPGSDSSAAHERPALPVKPGQGWHDLPDRRSIFLISGICTFLIVASNMALVLVRWQVADDFREYRKEAAAWRIETTAKLDQLVRVHDLRAMFDEIRGDLQEVMRRVK